MRYFYSFSLMSNKELFGFIPIPTSLRNAPPSQSQKFSCQKKSPVYSILRGAQMIFQPKTISCMAERSNFCFEDGAGISLHPIYSFPDSTHFLTYSIDLRIFYIIIINSLKTPCQTEELSERRGKGM